MDKILRGVAKYNTTHKAQIVKSMAKVVQPSAVVITCMDRRLEPSTMLGSEAGEIFYIRNAGNIVPHYNDYQAGSISTEGPGLELGCVLNHIKNVIVCGHSDCKAMHGLYDLRHNCDHHQHHQVSPLKTWITYSGRRTAEKFCEMEDAHQLQKKPLNLSVNLGAGMVKAVIDSENKYNIQDKLSQINTLMQASHVTTYPFLQPLLKSGEVTVLAMWYDIGTGDIYMFSPSQQKFVQLDDSGVNVMMKELKV